MWPLCFSHACAGESLPAHCRGHELAKDPRCPDCSPPPHHFPFPGNLLLCRIYSATEIHCIIHGEPAHSAVIIKPLAQQTPAHKHARTRAGCARPAPRTQPLERGLRSWLRTPSDPSPHLAQNLKSSPGPGALQGTLPAPRLTAAPTLSTHGHFT